MNCHQIVTWIFLGVLFTTKITSGDPSTELRAYMERVRIIYNLLDEECPDWETLTRQKRSVIGSLDHLDVEKRLYNKLMDELIRCRARNKPTTALTTTKQALKSQSSTNQIRTKSPTTAQEFTTLISRLGSPATTLKTEKTAGNKPKLDPPSTTPSKHLKPLECENAMNLTGSWRLERKGKDLRGGGPHSDRRGYSCDLFITDWFRFSDDGGTHMLNTCPMVYSCGTYIPYWTDDDMPEKVGVRAEVKMYAVMGDDCKHGSSGLSVVRCSEKRHDFVYLSHYSRDHGDIGGSICAAAFCGMN